MEKFSNLIRLFEGRLVHQAEIGKWSLVHCHQTNKLLELYKTLRRSESTHMSITRWSCLDTLYNTG